MQARIKEGHMSPGLITLLLKNIFSPKFLGYIEN